MKIICNWQQIVELVLQTFRSCWCGSDEIQGARTALWFSKYACFNFTWHYSKLDQLSSEYDVTNVSSLHNRASHCHTDCKDITKNSLKKASFRNIFWFYLMYIVSHMIWETAHGRIDLERPGFKPDSSLNFSTHETSRLNTGATWRDSPTTYPGMLLHMISYYRLFNRTCGTHFKLW